MNYQFRPAKRSNAKPLVGLYSESGCGKTLSALYLARGFTGDKGRIGMIETEAGRGEAYADVIPGGYDVLPIRDDFSPVNYGKAIAAADAANLDALIIDSASHEWEGAGGVLSMAADNEAAGKKGQLVWQKPKMDHQRHFILRLLATPIPLVIICMRAKYPMRQTIKPDGGKEWGRSEQLEPTQSDGILSELFVHGWIDREHRFHATKYTLDNLREALKDNEPISIETGRRLAIWASDAAVSQSGPKKQDAADPFGTMLATFGKMKTIIGLEQYYRCLGAHGVVHANEFRKLNLARACYTEMLEIAKALKESTPEGEK